jgi:hypothetical protein
MLWGAATTWPLIEAGSWPEKIGQGGAHARYKSNTVSDIRFSSQQNSRPLVALSRRAIALRAQGRATLALGVA